MKKKKINKTQVDLAVAKEEHKFRKMGIRELRRGHAAAANCRYECGCVDMERIDGRASGNIHMGDRGSIQAVIER